MEAFDVVIAEIDGNDISFYFNVIAQVKDKMIKFIFEGSFPNSFEDIF